jgi:hypothetical protein
LVYWEGEIVWSAGADMNADDKVNAYRITNALYGVLESSERIRYELIQMRYLQASSQQKSRGQRIVAILLVLVGAIPALYGLLPDTLGNLRFLWLGAASVLGMLYLVVGIWQWWHDREAAAQVRALLPRGAEAEPEKHPEFLTTLLSFYSSRWWMAREIVADNPPEALRQRYALIQLYWERKLKDTIPMLQTLVAANKLQPNEYEDLIQWIPAELRQDQADGRKA